MGREENKQIVKKKIIEALFELTVDNPLEKVTADAIAEKAEVSKRTLYKYFPSKELMYLGMVQEAFEVFGGYIAIKPEQILEGSVVEGLVQIGRRYVDFMLVQPSYGNLIIEYDAMKYEQAYPDEVAAIESVAGTDTIPDFIKSMVEQGYIVIEEDYVDVWLYMWSFVQGLSKLVLVKGQWMESYYDVHLGQIIDRQMMQMRHYLEGVIKDVKE